MSVFPIPAAFPWGARVVASMATFPERHESFKLAFASIAAQFDAIVIYLNGYTEVPAWLQRWAHYGTPPSPEYMATGKEESRRPVNPAVIPILGEDFPMAAGDLGSSGKLYALRYLEPDHILFTVDDDIVYPRDYREVMMRHLRELGGVVSVHGARFKHPIKTFLKSRHVFSFEADVARIEKTHVPGAGTCCFRAGDLDLSVPEDFTERNMCDLELGIACELQGVPRYTVPHQKGWLVPLPNPGFSVRERYLRDDGGRTRLAKSIKWR